MTGQFDQQRLLDPGPEEDMPLYRRRRAQEEHPIPGAFSVAETYHNSAHRSFAIRPEGHTRSHDQLPMFMTAREITDEYQPLDGDRQDAQDWREGSFTARSHLTGGQSNYSRRDWVTATSGPRRGEKVPVPVTGTDRKFQRVSAEESDDQLWDRKYEEASMDYMDYRQEVHGEDAPSPKYDRPGGGETDRSGTWRNTWKGPSRTDSTPRQSQTYEPFEMAYGGGESIRDSVLRTGVQQPISLSRQFGSSGKPQIIGGHHRISVMRAERPDTLMPVSHHDSLSDAKGNPYWKYT